MIDIAQEAQDHRITMSKVTPTFKTNLFKDSTGAIELIKTHKFRPRTKHINTRYFHFWQLVEQEDIEVVKVASEDQIAGILTKPLEPRLFYKHCKSLLVWKQAM